MVSRLTQMETGGETHRYTKLFFPSYKNRGSSTPATGCI